MKGPRIFASRLASLISLSVVLAALIGVALADAQSQSPGPTGPHLLVVPDTREGEAALARSDARVVAGYESFTLVEAAGADDERLRRAGADRRDDMRTVRTAAGELDPRSARQSLAGKEAPDRDEVLALAQFVGPPKEAWIERLRGTGARVIGYVAQNGYLVHARESALDRLAGLVGTDPAVRAVMRVEGRDKIEDASRGGSVAVQTVAGERGAEVRRRARALGPSLRGASAVAGVETQFLRLAPAEVAELARDPAVLLIEPYAEPELLDERASELAVGGGLSGPDYLGWLDSQGFPDTPFDFTIDVTDGGLDNGSASAPDHADFGSRVTYADDYTADLNARDCAGHGTNVASIAAGLNEQTGSAHEDDDEYNYGLGVAPRALIGASKIFRCGGGFDPSTNFTSITSSAYGKGARISNNSWGRSTLGEYDADSMEYDALVRDAQPSVDDNQEMVEVFAAGNEGQDVSGTGNEGYASISSPGTAKNVITVGASENLRSIGFTDGCGVPDSGADAPSDIIDFSSRGPTDDQRVKPDLVAPGTHMVGARPRHGGYTGSGACQGQEQFPPGSFYNLISGTSQAAPVVAGAAALIRDWYRREHGSGTNVPSPALTKAILTNTAADLAGGNDGKGSTVPASPSMDAGWGRVSLTNVFDEPAQGFVDQTVVLESSGETAVRYYDVPAAGRPVKVTLAWTDAVPATSGGDAFVNNLDLEVSAGGRTYLGNVLSGGRSIPGGSPDTRNNLESVVLPAGAATTVAVKVTATQLGGDGVPDENGDGLPTGDDTTDQDFALMVSNATELPGDRPTLVHRQTTVDEAPGNSNGNGALEPGESFELDEEVRNTGTETATEVSGTLSGNGELTVAQADADYPDLAPNAAGNNVPRFVGGLSGAASCGVDATATLSLMTDQGPHTVPVTLPTGAESDPTPRARTESPALSIPDDSSAGMFSTLNVGSAGRIKDLNVRIAGISHGWVGDLSLELTGPDGTTVTLARHPGGPDNNGNNFANTVFDDEAPASISAGNAPYTGSFRPQNDQLSRFDGKPQQGAWKLRVRDLFETDTGTLSGWGTDTSNAQCAPDTSPPLTVIYSGPSGIASSRDAVFGFRATESDSTFECKLDGGDYVPCNTPHSYGSLADGEHTFAVRAFDAQGNVDADPATRTWTVDATPPAVTLSSPPGGSTTDDSTPSLRGTAGTTGGDAGTVTVQVFSGALAAGLPTQTLIVPRDGASGVWSAESAALADGKWTVRAEQRDAAGNVGVSAPSTFTVAASVPPPPPRPAPSFLLAPAEDRLADALAARYTVLAACASACKVSAKLTASARAARRLGLRSRTVSLGTGAKRLSSAGTAAVRLRLTFRARAALGDRAMANATLRVTSTVGGERLTLNRTVALHRSAGLARMARRGLRLWAVCSRNCPLTGRLTVSASQARRLRLKTRGSGRVEIASERTTAGRGGGRLTLKIRRSATKPLKRARRTRALFEAVAGRAPDPRRTAERSVTLHR